MSFSCEEDSDSSIYDFLVDGDAPEVRNRFRSQAVMLPEDIQREKADMQWLKSRLKGHFLSPPVVPAADGRVVKVLPRRKCQNQSDGVKFKRTGVTWQEHSKVCTYVSSPFTFVVMEGFLAGRREDGVPVLQGD